MIKASDVVLTGLMIAAAVWTFQIKHEAELATEKVVELQKEISKEKDLVGLLQADWSVLTQPGYLKNVEEVFRDELQLQPLKIDQITTPDDLPPLRLPAIPNGDRIGDLARGEGVDPVVTGSIREPGQ